ncbi:MAG TPA: CinA family nicotinamide mononucleotide deamidase-related protein [Patescibacteria group bacterium]|nr:CinA family nicotinamide mononucleotide deamidase-related protein [Patescibacteria group bacterium]
MSAIAGPRALSAAVIAVGTELVADGRQDTNGATIGLMLASIGYETATRTCVADDEELIAFALEEAARRVSLVIVTGGLGPTVDDVTREAAARAFDAPLQQDNLLLEDLRLRYQRRGMKFSEWSARQAMVPRGAEPIPNQAGTAPGLLFIRPNGTLVALLPGVPHEMERMMTEQLLPRLRDLAAAAGGDGGGGLVTRGLKTTGLNEIEVQTRVLDLFDAGHEGGTTLTLLASPGEVSVIVRGRNAAAVESTWTQARARLGEHVFADDAFTGLESAVARVRPRESSRSPTAESCTGGLLGSLITKVPGSSRWYLQGWITYSNESKVASLGIDRQLLELHGAVSEQVATAMAEAARQRSGADIAVSITGIAGPEGGTQNKPVGLVYLATATEASTRVTRHLFPGDRQNIRLFSARAALGRVRAEI